MSSPYLHPADPPDAENLCFHCGLPISAGTVFRARVGGVWREMCCPGCEAVATTIAGAGLDNYYRLREAAGVATARTPDVAGRSVDDLALYDDAALQERFVRRVPAAARQVVAETREDNEIDASPEWCEADLLLEGVHCTACIWLIEQVLAGVPGVTQVSANFANRRARVCWQADRAPFSRILAAIRAIGYEAWPHEPSRFALLEKKERANALWRLFVAGFGMMQAMMYAWPVYVADEGTMSADIEQLMRWAGLLLTLPVVTYSAAPFFSGAWRDVRNKQLGMDVPVSVGLSVAFLTSVVSTMTGQGSVYFDSVSMFVFLLLAGRYLELLARQRAGRSLQHLARLVPESANRLTGPGMNSTTAIPAVTLKADDRVLVRSGEVIPADGVLESAAATVSEALLSGESRPLEKRRGDALIGGSINVGDPLVLRAQRTGGDSMLGVIVRLMERAMSERPRAVDMSRRAASFFVVVILACALGAGVLWLWLEPARALWIAVSVLIVTCPCALSLALPMAMTVATGAMARIGLVPTRGHTIESLASVTDVVFDKTGTLTEGRLGITETLVFDGQTAGESLAIAGALAHVSTHPASRALVDAAHDLSKPVVQWASEQSGLGIEGVIDGCVFRVGQSSFVSALHGRTTPMGWTQDNQSTLWLGNDRGWIAAFRLGDLPRPGATIAVAELQALGLRVHLLSGDAPVVANAIGARLGITSISSGANPAEKLIFVGALQATGARVAMVGDGINDAPVLAQADVSIAMRSGADLAQVGADAVLVTNSPRDVVAAIRLARKTRMVARQNLFWALAYNLIALPLAVAGWVTPLIAGIGMSGSSLLVVLNATRLNFREFRVGGAD